MGEVAYVVSPHGFGHAARSCAVMSELRRQSPAIDFHIFTDVPSWLFSESLPDCFSHHPFATDVGLSQLSPLIEDLEATADLLDQKPVDDPVSVARLATEIEKCGCSVVVVDISPLGLAAAAEVGIPSILIENFTWDWIYLNYPGSPPRLRHHGREMVDIFASADFRIQTDPVCQLRPGSVTVGPVARNPRTGREEIRVSMGIPVDEAMIVVSMGGVPWDYREFSGFVHADGPWIVVPGGSEGRARREGRLLLLPFHAEVYHPDLVAASDLVVSKLGYSTVAEAYRAGSALLYVGRPRFPESPVLARWVEEKMAAAEIEESALRGGGWLAAANELLEVPRRKPDAENGAVQAAEAILERFPFLKE